LRSVSSTVTLVADCDGKLAAVKSASSEFVIELFERAVKNLKKN
jgi:hypothetical protein